MNKTSLEVSNNCIKITSNVILNKKSKSEEKGQCSTDLNIKTGDAFVL